MSSATPAPRKPGWFTPFVLTVIALNIAVVLWMIWPTTPPQPRIPGVPLPASATDVQLFEQLSPTESNYFLSAVMPLEDFKQLVSSLGMTNHPGLLPEWPNALATPDGAVWFSEPVNGTNTFFVARTSHSDRLVARYENGRLFLRRRLD